MKPKFLEIKSSLETKAQRKECFKDLLFETNNKALNLKQKPEIINLIT